MNAPTHPLPVRFLLSPLRRPSFLSCRTACRSPADADRAEDRGAGGRLVGLGVRPALDDHGGYRPGRVGAVLLRADGVERRHPGDQTAADSRDVALQRGNFQVKRASGGVCSPPRITWHRVDFSGALHGSGQTSRVTSGRFGSGWERVARPNS